MGLILQKIVYLEISSHSSSGTIFIAILTAYSIAKKFFPYGIFKSLRIYCLLVVKKVTI